MILLHKNLTKRASSSCVAGLSIHFADYSNRFNLYSFLVMFGDFELNLLKLKILVPSIIPTVTKIDYKKLVFFHFHPKV